MKTLRMLIIAAAIAMMAAPVMAGPVLSTTLNFGTFTIPVTMDIIPWVNVSGPGIKLSQIGTSTTWQGSTTLTVQNNFPDLDVDAVINPVAPNVGDTYNCCFGPTPWGPTAHTNIGGPNLGGISLLVGAQILNVNPAARAIGDNQLVANVVLTFSQTTP